MSSSRRFSLLAEREINKETYVEPWAEAGLIVVDSPHDPQPSLRLDPLFALSMAAGYGALTGLFSARPVALWLMVGRRA